MTDKPNKPKPPTPIDTVRAWDLAVTDKTDADYSAGGLLTLLSDGHLYLRDVVRLQANWPTVRSVILETARLDGPLVTILIPESGTQKGFLQDLQVSSDFAQYTIIGIPETSAKLVRANRWIARLAAGRFHLIQGPWVRDFLAECESFTGHVDTHDDMVDSVSMGYHHLAPMVWDEPIGGESDQQLAKQQKSVDKPATDVVDRVSRYVRKVANSHFKRPRSRRYGLL